MTEINPLDYVMVAIRWGVATLVILWIVGTVLILTIRGVRNVLRVWRGEDTE